MGIFYMEEHNGRFLVKPNLALTNLDISKISGSWGVFSARLMGLSYANYLRMCRDKFGGEIIGKNKKYPNVFLTETNAKKLIKILDARWVSVSKT